MDISFAAATDGRVEEEGAYLLMANVLQAFEEYPWDKLDGIWACYFNNLRSIMACDGGNDYKQAHNGGTKRKRDTGSAIDLSINLDDYDRCLRLCRR